MKLENRLKLYNLILIKHGIKTPSSIVEQYNKSTRIKKNIMNTDFNTIYTKNKRNQNIYIYST